MIGWIKEWLADIKAWWNQEPAVQPVIPEPDSLPTPIAAVLKKVVRKRKK